MIFSLFITINKPSPWTGPSVLIAGAVWWYRTISNPTLQPGSSVPADCGLPAVLGRACWLQPSSLLPLPGHGWEQRLRQRALWRTAIDFSQPFIFWRQLCRSHGPVGLSALDQGAQPRGRGVHPQPLSPGDASVFRPGEVPALLLLATVRDRKGNSGPSTLHGDCPLRPYW